MAELADALDLGSSGRPCRFESCYPHFLLHFTHREVLVDKLLDYVKWMGDYTFEELPFSEADTLVLTSVSYFDLKHCSFQSGQNYCLSDLKKAFEEGLIQAQMTGESPEVSELMAEVIQSRRFGSLPLIEYADVLDPSVPVQFSAMVFQIHEDTMFLAYRGTDETIAGWQEDFMISFTETDSQRRAAAFAKHVMEEYDKGFIISGHSKGGNLALYAAASLSPELRQRVDHIYLLDSPGFCPEVFPAEMYQDLLPRCTLIVPEFSVIGRIFELPVMDRKIVGSDQEGIMQHMLASWQIDHGKPYVLPKTDPASDLINNTVDRFIENTDLESRKPLVDDLFKALSADGAVTLSDIAGKGGTGFEAVLFRMFGLSEEARDTLLSAPLKSLLGNEADALKESGFLKWVRDSMLLHAILLVLGGILLVLLRDTLLKVPVILIFTALVIFQIVMTIRRLKENHWDFAKTRYSVYFSLGLIAISAILILKEHALFLFGSLLIGLGGLVLAYQAILRFTRLKGFLKVLSLIEFIVLLGMSGLFLISSQDLFRAAALFIGIALITDGAVRLGYLIFENRKKRKGSAV